jgi:hypothetical protein
MNPRDVQFYGIKTADNLGLYKVVPGPIPDACDPSEFWPVNAEVPAGQMRSGWQLVAGTVEPVLVPIPTAPIPESVRATQLKQWMVDNGGKDELVQAILDNPAHPIWQGSEAARKKARVRWNEVTINRYDPLTVGIGTVLGMSEADIDAAFVEAEEYP